MTVKRCYQCEKTFECGSKGGCWCADYPAVLPVSDHLECLCPDCLSMSVADAIDKLMIEKSLQEMLVMARSYYSKGQLTENIDYYIEAGRYVFSAWYHLKRGSCCGNGCRHCPFV